MSVFESLPGRDRLRLKAASRWTRRIQADPLLAESPDFRDWVAKPANRRAFTAVERTLANLDALGGTPRIVDMRRAGLARLRKSEAQRWPRRQVLVRSAATVVLTVFAGEGLVFVGGQVPKAYATDVGERRVIALPDGSRIVLDSAS